MAGKKGRTFFLQAVSGEATGGICPAARGGLFFASVLYDGVIRARRFLYGEGIIRSHRLPGRVVCVGNITLGGTGKTPMVAWLSRWLAAQGRRVAILSRGYGRTNGGASGDDEAFVADPAQENIRRFVGGDRVRTGTEAFRDFRADVAVLDDGFQHFRLRRDLDIVMIDSLNPFGNGRLFPRGTLREPVESLGRAQVIALSRTDLCEPAALRELRESLERRFPDAIVIECIHRPTELRSPGRTLECAAVKGRRIFAFCGIGNPDGFRKTLESLGADVIGFEPFPDHHVYSAGEIADIATRSSEMKADMVVTTEKDFARLPSGHESSAMMLKVEMGISSGLEKLESVLRKTVL